MKSKTYFLLVSLFFLVLSMEFSFSQTQTISLLNPGWDYGKYKFTQFGSYGGFLWNNNASSDYGNGDDFCLFTYNNRDMTIKTGHGDNTPSNGNFIIFPTIGTGKVGIGLSNPSATLHVNGNIMSAYALISSLTISQQTYAMFSHKDRGSMYNYALLQAPWGETYINASSGWPIHFRINNNQPDKMTILPDGNIGIGTQSTFGYKLAVNGTIGAREVVVEETSAWPDYVFNNSYNLKTLNEVEQFISENGHLPEVPSVREVEENGVKLGEMNAMLLKKIEELTLYMIEQDKRIEELEKQTKNLN